MIQATIRSIIQVAFRNDIRAAALLALIVAAAAPGTSQSSPSQSKPDLETFFRQNIGLSQDEIDAIRSGQAVVKAMRPRSAAEVFLFGAIYIHAAPQSYVKFAHDFDRMAKLPNYLALGVFSNPPQLSDLKDFAFDKDDIKSLTRCQPSSCLLQMPTSEMEEFRQSIDWTAPDAVEQANQRLQKTALRLLLAYQHEGNRALGIYNDKRDTTDVSREFGYMLSYSKALSERVPDFYNYLLAYPDAKLGNVENTFYWARVKFGLKPTLRVVHLISVQGSASDPLACAIAEKQLYSTHYFETALDLHFCVRGDDPKQPGFYLIMAMGSENRTLATVKGEMIRKVAVGRSVSNLQKALTTIKNTLEGGQ